MAVLLHLAEHPRRVCSRQSLLRAVWADAFVTEEVLTHAVWELRKLLGDDAKQPKYIQTVPKQGYRLVAEVSRTGAEASQAERPAAQVTDSSSMARSSLPSRRQWTAWRWRVAGLVVLAVAVATVWVVSRGSSPARGAGAIGSLAVLPFENMMSNPEQQYFVDGMHEALITDLSKIGALKVISRTSVMRYRATETPIPEIARELGVDALVEGSVLLADNDVRISAQLIHGATDLHLWAESYTRPLEDVLALHSEISRAIADEIAVVSGTEGAFRREVAKLSTTREVDPETYQSYLKGMFFLNQSSPEGTQKGMEFLREAVERSPDDPFTYAGLALGYAAIGHSPYGGAPEFRKASEPAARAVELDDSIAEAQLALGDVRLYYEWDFEGAGEALERALELSPNLAAAHYHYGWYLELVGRPDEAEEHMVRARDLDPLAPKYSAWLAGYYAWRKRGRLPEAIEEAHRALELAPDNPVGLLVLGVLYQNSNRLQEAVEMHERLAEVAPMGFGLARLAQSYALAGRTEDAQELILRIERTPDLQHGMGLALAHLALGDHDRAIFWLDYAAQRRESYFPWLLRWPEFEDLHDDPRFQELAARYDLPGSSGHAT